jgi:hypothetical protein
VGPKVGLEGAENLAPPGFDPRTVQLVASRYTDRAIVARKQVTCFLIYFYVVYKKSSCEFALANIKAVRFELTRTVYVVQGRCVELVVINVSILRCILTGGHHNGGWG